MQVVKIFHSRNVVLRDIVYDNIVLVSMGAGTKGWTFLDYGNSPNERTGSSNFDNGAGQANTADRIAFPCRQASPEVWKSYIGPLINVHSSHLAALPASTKLPCGCSSSF